MLVRVGAPYQERGIKISAGSSERHSAERWMGERDARGKNKSTDFGSGAREHALAQACAKSPMVGNLLVAPGNPGCATVARIVPLRLTDHAKVIAFCRSEAIDLVVVGPEAPLVSGLADELADAGILCFGPTRNAARLEGSKGYAKDFCRESSAYLPAIIGGFGIPMKPRRISAVVARRLSLKQTGWLPVKVWLSRRRSRRRRPRLTQCCPPFWEPHQKSSSKTSSKERRFRSSLCATAQPHCLSPRTDHKRVGEGDTSKHRRDGRLFSAENNDARSK